MIEISESPENSLFFNHIRGISHRLLPMVLFPCVNWLPFPGALARLSSYSHQLFSGMFQPLSKLIFSAKQESGPFQCGQERTL